MKKILTLALIGTVMTISLSGCYGSFAFTKKVYDFNGQISNKWVNEAIFFVFGGPVYGFTVFADAVVLNTIEFWTGSNPVASNTLEQQDQAGNKLIATKIPGGALELTVIKADGTVNSMTLTKSDDMVKAFDENGKVIARIAAPAEEAAQ